MRILVFHGYLLGGTGSNVYNARLAQALVRLGHEVHLLCQERYPEQAAFVDVAGDWDDGRLTLRALSAGPARCTLYRPAIGGLLPVYVHDRYEEIEARTFACCSEAEVTHYLAANVEAVAEVVRLAQPHIALANHLVMGPAILARALGGSLPYAVKVHGSALEYTVKPDLERFLPFAEEGLAGASGVLVGSLHTAQSLWQALGAEWVHEHDLLRRTRLGPPGVDIHAFAPRDPEQAGRGLSALARRLSAAAHPQLRDRNAEGAHDEPSAGGRAHGDGVDGDGSHGDGSHGDATHGSAASEPDVFARDERRAAKALAGLAAGEGPTVVYVGKLIVSKGVDLLLAAWPLVLQRVPKARLVVVGFGGLQGTLEEVWAAMAAGSLEPLSELAGLGRALEGGKARPLVHLRAFLAFIGNEGQKGYLAAAGASAQSVLFTGRLDHEELADLLPACEAIVVPSTFPEAFGMVAVEGAACGLLPISAGHSGLAEVSERLAALVPEQAAPLLSFPVDEQAVSAIGERLSRWLCAPEDLRAKTREQLVCAVRRLWSWEGVGEAVIAAAQGRVDELPAPAGGADERGALQGRVDERRAPQDRVDELPTPKGGTRR